MADPYTEAAYAPRRSSRISAQVRPEAPAKRTRKAPSTAAKSTKAGSSRKRTLKEDQEGDQDAADVEREQDVKKVQLRVVRVYRRVEGR